LAALQASHAASDPLEDSDDNSTPLFRIPSFTEFRADYGTLVKVIHSAPVSTFAFRRLQLLESKFNLHRLLNHVRQFVC
jgi:AMP deaminase